MKLKDIFEDKRDTDFSNLAGWEAGVQEVWPDSEVTRGRKPMHHIFFSVVKNRVVGQWDTKLNKGYVLLSEMSSVEINHAESRIRQMFLDIGINVKFTRHFGDRIIDGAKDEHGSRRDNVTYDEMISVFERLKKSHDELFLTASDHVDEIKRGQFEGVIRDNFSAINIPFVLNFVKSTQMFELVCKTIMKRRNFHTKETDHVIKVS